MTPNFNAVTDAQAPHRKPELARTETCALRTLDNTSGVLDRVSTEVFGRSPKRRRCPVHTDPGKARGIVGFENEDKLAGSQIVPMTSCVRL